MTGQYWVLKNYLKTCSDEYVGFAHYRRLPDLLNISDTDEPSIFGINYSESVRLFDDLNKADLASCCQKYDVILPCTCYMYEKTVNPSLRSNEKHYNVYDHFKCEHSSDLLDVLKSVIPSEYSEALQITYSAEKSHFYNFYIMKKNLLVEYLNWLFDLLSKLGEKIGGWEQPQYLRMAGFVSEALINVWLNSKSGLKLGYVPVYMVDFDAEYIELANKYHSQGELKKEVETLEKLLGVTSDKFVVVCAIIEGYINLKADDKVREYIELAKLYASDGYNYFSLAGILSNYSSDLKNEISEIFTKAIELSPKEALFQRSYLHYAERIRDVEITKNAWDMLMQYGELSSEEEKKYQNFKKIYELVNG